MKAKKALAETITNAVEQKLAETGEQPKKVKKAIEKSAKKLSGKLTKIFEKIKKKEKKVQKKLVKAEKNSVPQMIKAPEREKIS